MEWRPWRGRLRGPAFREDTQGMPLRQRFFGLFLFPARREAMAASLPTPLNDCRMPMDNSPVTAPRGAVHLEPGAGRAYPMGRIAAVFKADGIETANRYSISEWWLEAQTQGPGAHAHPEDDVFFVIEGTMSFLIGDAWIDAPRGSFVLAPGGLTHDFENRSTARAGVLNFSIPGDFETHMPDIASWFAEHPPGPASG